ncbi:barstar family protein [Sinomonas sp. ASV322]|uniref:barstar family protein n=1 Tax=Sinomonas sp. ASV322 TaxID=3041920 RepID=UPI0027DE731A|nr:barstar family protein [Sinomonas sp. ASV322]MDQ4503833.1 barstar family protein [Sinomonas sp. ASV322]
MRDLVAGAPTADELVEELGREAHALGRRFAVVRRVEGLRPLLAAFGTALGFPDYYGVNLDALRDCLGDLVEHIAGGAAQPLTLVWEVDAAFRSAEAYPIVRGIFEEAEGDSRGGFDVVALAPA